MIEFLPFAESFETSKSAHELIEFSLFQFARLGHDELASTAWKQLSTDWLFQIQLFIVNIQSTFPLMELFIPSLFNPCLLIKRLQVLARIVKNAHCGFGSLKFMIQGDKLLEQID